MKSISLAFLMSAWLGAVCVAQQPTPTPKPDPFKDFGHTALDQQPAQRRPGGRVSTPQPFNSDLGLVSSSLSFDAKTTSNGGHITTNSAPYVESQVRESHPVIEVQVRNMAGAPATAHFDYFFIASAINGRAPFVWDRGELDIPMPASNSHSEFIESKAITQQATTQTYNQQVTVTSGGSTVGTYNQHVSEQRRSGSKPSGWIVRMFVDGKLAEVRASSPGFESIARNPAQLQALLAEQGPQPLPVTPARFPR